MFPRRQRTYTPVRMELTVKKITTANDQDNAGEDAQSSEKKPGLDKKTGTVFIEVPATLRLPEITLLSDKIGSLRPGDVAVLRGTSETFCAGMDLNLAAHQDASLLQSGLRAYADLLLTVRTCPCVVIALVEGGAFGGGVGLAAACDLVLASSQARFGLPEALHSFYPAIVFAVLQERLAPQKARRLALLCESIDAAEAKQLGLVDLWCEQAMVEQVLQRHIRKLQRAAPLGVAAIKGHPTHVQTLRAALEEATQVSLNAMLAPEVSDALAALASPHITPARD